MGWYMAEMVYKSVIASGELPPITSPIGKMCILYIKMCADKEFFSNHVIVQALVSPKKIDDVYKKFIYSHFPYMSDEDKNKEEKLRENFYKEMKKGPIRVIPLIKQTPSFRKKK